MIIAWIAQFQTAILIVHLVIQQLSLIQYFNLISFSQAMAFVKVNVVMGTTRFLTVLYICANVNKKEKII